MADYQDMRTLARLSKVDFSDIDSLDAINRRKGSRFENGYPANGTPEWWALRYRYEQLLKASIRKLRSGTHIKAGDTPEDEADAAKWAALGNEQADADYRAFVPSVYEVTERQKRRCKGWLEAQAEAAVKKIA